MQLSLLKYVYDHVLLNVIMFIVEMLLRAK